MDMDSFKSINEQRATVRHGRLIPVVSGLRPVAICIEWLTRTHIHTHRHTHGTHNEPSKRLNDSLANKYVCHWGQGEHKKKTRETCPKMCPSEVRPFMPVSSVSSPQSLSGLFIVRSQIQHLRVRQLLVLCQFGALQI